MPNHDANAIYLLTEDQDRILAYDNLTGVRDSAKDIYL